jgi:hypothetical protein
MVMSISGGHGRLGMSRKAVLAILMALAAAPASANDTTAELATGGLIFVRSEQIAMESEDLYISPSEVRVKYQFRNRGEDDIESVVAFPMPNIKADPYTITSVPEASSDNFLGFTVEVDGRRIAPRLDQRAFAAEVDVTELLAANGVPLWPYHDSTREAIDKLAPEVLEDWHARGILYPEEFDDGSGWKKVWSPFWELKSTYWWRMTFPAGKPIEVKHSDTPSVGGTVDVTFLEDGKAKGERYDQYKAKYCVEGGFVRAVEAAVAKSRGVNPPYTESWISYVLTTGGNWATTIEKFRLTIDKGSPRNLVSFCGSGVKKTGATTFEIVAENFYPQRDLDILILQQLEVGGGGN